MGLFDKIFKKKQEPVVVKPPKEKKPRKPKENKVEPTLSEKDKATQAGEPYVTILKVDVDPSNIHSGSFELDWNEIFIARLVKAGYMKKKEDTDNDIIDRWFQDVCRNVALEVYEQQQADPSNRDMLDMRKIAQRDIGNGRTEVS
jgi:hypothetical protein